MNKALIATFIFLAAFVFYLLTGSADLAFFGMLMAYYCEFRLLRADH